MKLETKIRQLINEAKPKANARFEVVAFELWGNAREGFDCNIETTALHIIPRNHVSRRKYGARIIGGYSWGA